MADPPDRPDAYASSAPDAPDERAHPSEVSDSLPAQQVNYHFHNKVKIEEAAMGITSSPVKRRRTGPVPDSDVDLAILHYVKPAPFAAAADALRRYGLVILEGPPSIGKRAGAFALLDTCAAVRPFISLSPALSIDEIGRHKFRPGHGYIVRDRTGDTDTSVPLAYELEQLYGILRHRGAYLVLTTSTSMVGISDEIIIRWEPPASSQLLRRSLVDYGLKLPGGALGEAIAQRFKHCRIPSEITDFAARFDERRDDADAGARLLEQSDAEAVAKWFDDSPGEEDVVLVAALSFLDGMPEPQFEAELSNLQKAIWDNRQEGTDEDVPRTPQLVQRRHLRAQNLSLIAVAGSDEGASAERRITFASPAYRTHVIAELSRRYDRALWASVQEWIQQMMHSADTSKALSISLGLALLARAEPTEVARSCVEPWADGRQTEREAACYVLWFACLHDAQAPWALELAIRWARSPSPAIRTTAVACLSGELGLRYPGEALRWLWHMARRDGPMSAASRAFGDLFAASVRAGDDDVSVLTFLAARTRELPTRKAPSDVALLLGVFDLVLDARGTAGEPAVSALIIRRTTACAPAGALWARALVSRTHRGHAIGALRDTVFALGEMQNGRARTGELGAAILANLPMHEVPLLERDLYHQLEKRTRGDSQRARAIVSALLTASAAERGPTEEGSVA
jgi:hypothetical protein